MYSLAICLILQLGDLNWHSFTRVVAIVPIGNNATTWKTVWPFDPPVEESPPDPTRPATGADRPDRFPSLLRELVDYDRCRKNTQKRYGRSWRGREETASSPEELGKFEIQSATLFDKTNVG